MSIEKFYTSIGRTSTPLTQAVSPNINWNNVFSASTPTTNNSNLPTVSPTSNQNNSINNSTSNLSNFLGVDQGQDNFIVDQYDANLAALNQSSNRYIDDLLSQAGGDRDFAIKLLTRDHELALGTDNKARAEFLESVADKLEERIGTIPYDYQVATTRTNEDLARVQELTERNKSLALSRLSEDEKVWRDQFGVESGDARTNQQEALLRRGILQGTRDGATGLAGQEVGNLERDLTSTLTSFERLLGRTRDDIDREASDALFDAQRQANRQLDDLKTTARRGATNVQDTFSQGSEAAQRAYEAKKKQLEYQRQMNELNNEARANIMTNRGY